MSKMFLGLKKTRNRQFFIGGVGMILLLVAGGVYWSFVDPSRLGFFYDDAIYMVLGKSIAEGQGYKALYIMTEPTELLYFPLLPLFLSAAWKIWPAFPDNIPYFTGVIVAFSLASLVCCYYYLRQCKKVPLWGASLILALTAFNYFYMTYSSALMSEMPYLFFSLLALYTAEQALKREAGGSRLFLLTLLFSVLAFYTRAVGVTLIGAIFMGFLARKQWKQAFLYGGLSFCLSVLPWLFWTMAHTPSLVDDLNYPLVHQYASYSDFLVRDLLTEGSFWTSLLQDGFGGFFNALKLYVWPWGGLSAVWFVGLGLGGLFFTQALPSFRVNRVNGAKACSPSVFYLCFYVGAIILWRYEAHMVRFLVVILPLIWYYALNPFIAIVDNGDFKRLKTKIVVSGLVLFCLFQSFFITGGYLTFKSREGKDHNLEGQEKLAERQALLDYIKTSLPEEEVIGTPWSPLFYLYTGHPTYNTGYWSLKREKGEFSCSPEAIDALFRSMEHYGVRYFAFEPSMRTDQSLTLREKVPLLLLEMFPRHFTRIYTSPQGQNELYQIDYRIE